MLAKLTPEDRTGAEAQKYSAVVDGSFLGGMGAPIKLVLDGKPGGMIAILTYERV